MGCTKIIYDLLPEKLFMGYGEEQLSRTLTFDISQMQAELPGGVPMIAYMRPRDELGYLASGVTLEGSTLTWELSAHVMQYKGIGGAQIVLVDESGEETHILKSHVMQMLIGSSIPLTGGEPPEPWETWLEQILAAAARAESAAADAEAQADRAETAEAGAQQALIDAGSPVIYGRAQTLTDVQQQTARGNIAAASAADVSDLKSVFNEIAEVATDVVSVNRVLFLNNDQPFNGVLKSVAQQTVKVCGQNILDTSVVSNGTIKNDSGTDVADYNSRYYVNMIPVIPNEKLYINFGVQRIYEYDISKNWLRRTSPSNQEVVYGVFTVPSDTYYIQVQFNRIDSINLNEAQINHGSVGLDYAAYSETEYTATASGVEANFPALSTVWSDGSAFDIVTTNGMHPTEEFKTATENNTITIPECGTYDIWTIATATDDYSTPLGYDGADLSITYQEFLDEYFNTYVGNNNGYRVARRSLGDDSGHALELVEYDFIPEHYNRVVMISAGMNACELAPMWGLAYFIQALMDGTDEDGLNYIRNNVRLKVLPVINPWGFDQSPMDYYNANGVRINKNFNWKGSWAAMTGADANYRGSYPDSEAESKILKKWVNENAQIAELWIDCHSDVAGNTPYLNVAFVSHNEMYSAVASIQNAICDYYHEIGTLPSGTTDVHYSVAQLGNGYPKTVYSWDMCNVPAIMLEQYPNGTTYGASGTLNNSSYDIKNYVLMLRAYILGILKSNAKTFTAVGDAWKAYQDKLMRT